MLKFSVVMPVKNGARFIGAAIDSIRSQSHENWELLVLDAVSEDGSSDIASKFAASDPRITHIRSADDGMYDAIISGFDRTDSDWCSWLNADDMLTHWAMSTVADFVAKDDAKWLTGYPGCWDEAGRLRYVRPQGLYPQGMIRRGYFREGVLGYLQQESMFFSRALLSSLGDDDLGEVRRLKLAGDFLLWRKFAEHAELRTVPSVLGGFRRHPENMSSQRADEYRTEVLSTNPAAAIPLLTPLFAALFRAASARAALKTAAAVDLELINKT
ncbi:MAG: glycosyltransferase [Marinicaulis sp.]|nr:glycosyltransferase [Marinicaulis sp.]